MDFLIAATSTYSLAWLTGDERESVKMTQETLLWLLPARSSHCALPVSVPSFDNYPIVEASELDVRIAATQIEHWADARDAQGMLPILVRRLVSATSKTTLNAAARPAGPLPTTKTSVSAMTGTFRET